MKGYLDETTKVPTIILESTSASVCVLQPQVYNVSRYPYVDDRVRPNIRIISLATPTIMQILNAFHKLGLLDFLSSSPQEKKTCTYHIYLHYPSPTSKQV